MRATRSPVAPAPTAIPSSWPGVAISIEGLIGTNSKLVCQVYLEGSWGWGREVMFACTRGTYGRVRGRRSAGVEVRFQGMS